MATTEKTQEKPKTTGKAKKEDSPLVGELNEREAILVMQQRANEKNIEEASEEIAEILQKRGLRLIVNGQSPINNPSIMLVLA